MNSVVVKSAAEDAGIHPSTSVLELETNRHLHRRKSDRNGDFSRSRSRNVSASRSRNRSRAVPSFFGDDDDSSDDTGRDKSAVEIASLRAHVKALEEKNSPAPDIAVDILTPSHAHLRGRSTEKSSAADEVQLAMTI
jgi:hypothetical protein